jgi:hypothetical protein
MNDEQPLLLQTLLNIREDIGELKALQTAANETFAKHCADDAIAHGRIREIELVQAKQRGAVRTWGIIATGAATLISAAGAFLGLHK